MPPFPHSGSVPCRCPYKERIVRQTTVARTPNHQFVDGCRPALPPRLWQPRYPEGGEATVIYVEGSLKFQNSYRVSQLDFFMFFFLLLAHLAAAFSTTSLTELEKNYSSGLVENNMSLFMEIPKYFYFFKYSFR